MKIIILYDADASIEFLDIADRLVGSDIEEFLAGKGYSVNNRMNKLTIHGQLQELKRREQDDLKASLRKYGEEVDGGFEVLFEEGQPIVAGYLFDEPRDIAIDAARVDADGNLSLIGEDKEVRDGQYNIEPSDIFGGQLDYIISSIGTWMKEERV